MSLIQTQEPVILATFDYPYEGKRRIRTLEAIREAKKIKQAVRNTESGILEMIQVIKQHPNVDPNRIAIVGASFGAPFAIYAASESPDIRGLVLVHGFGEIESVLKHRLTQIWKKHIYFFSNLAAAIAAKIIVYWVNPPEPVEYARKLRPDQLVLLIESKTDSFVPMTSRIALEHALKQSPAIIETFKTDGDHLHPSAKNLIQNIIDLTVDFFKKQSWF